MRRFGFGFGVLGVVASAIVARSAAAAPDTTELDHGTVIYQRGAALYRTAARGDTKGTAETELAKLPGKNPTVRTLRSDARGTVLLVEVSGTWSWLALDGQAHTLTELPCADGPAELAEDGLCVLCGARATGRAGGSNTGSVIVNLRTGKQVPVALPAPRLAGTGKLRKLVWTDAAGVWAAPITDLARKTQVAPEPPLRGFLPSHDGARAMGVYADFVHEGKQQKPAEMLEGFALDGQGARRKGLPSALPLEWSHDNQYVLMQDGTAACLVRAMGGQYKCWKGYTAVSLAPDGSYALVLGDRDGKRALLRAQLAGPYDETPVVVTKPVDGSAAVWIPAAP
ncbi:MAG: hypothetical protein H6Q90_2147 [Deltaproteobacteria bacterium]|nr:hypothetical protein [Deltaproteobacteria bacterium]